MLLGPATAAAADQFAAAAGQAASCRQRRARASAHPGRLQRRLRGRRARSPAQPDGRQARRRVRAAGHALRRHHPELAVGQRLRAADRPALRHARADRARQRHLRAGLGARPRDVARDRAARRDARGPGQAGRAGRPRRQRRAERSGNRRAGAREIQDHARELLARAGVRGRRHRRRHRGARRLRSLWRDALPRLDGTQRRAAANPGQTRIDPRSPDFLSSHPATPERIKNAQTNARQFSAAGRRRARPGGLSRRHRRHGLRRGPERRLRARTRASCTPSSASPSWRRRASCSTTPRRRCSASRTAAARRCGSTSCACRPKRSSRTISTSGWIENIDPKSVEDLTINGFPMATATAKGDQWSFRLYAVRFGSDVYRFIFATKQMTQDVDRVFRESVSTLPPHDAGGKPGHQAAAPQGRDGRRPATRSSGWRAAWRSPTARSSASASSTASRPGQRVEARRPGQDRGGIDRAVSRLTYDAFAAIMSAASDAWLSGACPGSKQPARDVRMKIGFVGLGAMGAGHRAAADGGRTRRDGLQPQPGQGAAADQVGHALRRHAARGGRRRRYRVLDRDRRAAVSSVALGDGRHHRRPQARRASMST